MAFDFDAVLRGAKPPRRAAQPQMDRQKRLSSLRLLHVGEEDRNSCLSCVALW